MTIACMCACVCVKWLLNDDGLSSIWDFTATNIIFFKWKFFKKRREKSKNRSHCGCYLFIGFICSLKCWAYLKAKCFYYDLRSGLCWDFHIFMNIEIRDVHAQWSYSILLKSMCLDSRLGDYFKLEHHKVNEWMNENIITKRESAG